MRKLNKFELALEIKKEHNPDSLAVKLYSRWLRFKVRTAPVMKAFPQPIVEKQRLSKKEMDWLIWSLDPSGRQCNTLEEWTLVRASWHRISGFLGSLHEDDMLCILRFAAASFEQIVWSGALDAAARLLPDEMKKECYLRGMENVHYEAKLKALELSKGLPNEMRLECCLKGLAWSYEDGELRQEEYVQRPALEAAASLPDEMKKTVALKGMESVFETVQIAALKLSESLPEKMREECGKRAFAIAIERLEGDKDWHSIGSTKFGEALPAAMRDEFRKRAYPVAIKWLENQHSPEWLEYSKNFPSPLDAEFLQSAYEKAISVLGGEKEKSQFDVFKLANAMPDEMKKECLKAAAASPIEYMQRYAVEYAEKLPDCMKAEIALVALKSEFESIQQKALWLSKGLPKGMREECLRYARQNSGFKHVRRKAGFHLLVPIGLDVFHD
ncbi:MAG: hypothetical protein NTX79_07020 [Candidatus Micrarchaeota archaeon]|nr:hypothetical protein [Candidatus Micrarchaeota archaeon]